MDTNDDADQDALTSTSERTDARVVVEHLHELPGVVVGDDCSPAASTAVLWAVEDAARRGCPLHVVRGWSISTAPRPDSAVGGYTPSMCEYEDTVRARMEEQWASVRGRVPELHLQPVHQQPAKALIEASKSADVVVVGASGRGRVARIVLGSVTKDVVKHAHCPVVVVPSPRDDDR